MHPDTYVPHNQPVFRPEVENLLRYFDYHHLPERLQVFSAPFHDLANTIANRSPRHPETEHVLRDLLKAKDAAVRTLL